MYFLVKGPVADPELELRSSSKARTGLRRAAVLQELGQASGHARQMLRSRLLSKMAGVGSWVLSSPLSGGCSGKFLDGEGRASFPCARQRGRTERNVAAKRRSEKHLSKKIFGLYYLNARTGKLWHAAVMEIRIACKVEGTAAPAPSDEIQRRL